MPLTIKLEKPIKRGDSEIAEIELRDVETNDYIRLGAVGTLLVNKKGEQVYADRPEIVQKYLTRLSGLSEKEIGQMELKDFFKAKEFISNQLAFAYGSEVTGTSQG